MSIAMPWESHSYYERVKQALWLEQSPSHSLLQELNETDTLKSDTTTKVIAYLADYKNGKLEKALVKKFTQTTSREVSEILNSVAAFSIDTARLRMLDVCQRVVSLTQLKELSKVENVIQLAKADALITPKPQRSFEAISKSLLHQWNRNSGVLEKVTQYFVSTVAWSYSIDLENPPKNRWVAQSQWSFFRDLGVDLLQAGTTFLQFFSTTWKAGVCAAGIIASLIGLKYLYNRYHVGTPDTLDKKYFRNLNNEAKAGLLKKTVGRKKELRMLETCLSPPPGHSPRICILVGEPGVGKTQLVEGLTLNIVNGETVKLAGKKVFVVNTADLLGEGNFSEHGYSSRLDTLFEQISGFEDQIILFFDEAHNAASPAQNLGNSSTGMLLEQLKTKLLEKNVLCILATTTEEYEKHIATNKAFVDRTKKIEFPSLSDDETRVLLQEKTSCGSVEITLDAIEEVLNVARQHPGYKERSNPRKSVDILQEAINHVYAWTPTQLSHDIEKLELEYQKYLTQCTQSRSREPGWGMTDTGKIDLEKLEVLRKRLQTLREEKAAEKTQLEKITRLKEMKPVYSRRENEIIHLLAGSGQKPSVEAQKTYLFMQFILLPKLSSQIEIEAGKLKEKMPLKVDQAVIQHRFPVPASTASAIWQFFRISMGDN